MREKDIERERKRDRDRERKDENRKWTNIAIAIEQASNKKTE